jgi:hypothetical protein
MMDPMYMGQIHYFGINSGCNLVISNAWTLAGESEELSRLARWLLHSVKEMAFQQIKRQGYDPECSLRARLQFSPSLLHRQLNLSGLP